MLGVVRKLNKVLVSGVNMVRSLSFVSFTHVLIAIPQVKKHVPEQDGRKGGIFQLEAPVDVSKVSLLDPKDGSVHLTLLSFPY